MSPKTLKRQALSLERPDGLVLDTVDFSGWEYVRGHEGDMWRTHPDPSWVGAPAMPARSGDLTADPRRQVAVREVANLVEEEGLVRARPGRGA